MFNYPVWLRINSRLKVLFVLGIIFLVDWEIHNQPVIAQSIKQDSTIENITDNIAKFLGQTVTVKGSIEEKHSDSALTIEDERYFNGERILVIDRSGELVPKLPEADTPIQVTGKVERLETVNLIRNQDLDLSPDVVALFKERPAIIADSIVLAPDPGEITEEPQNYYERPVAVEGKVEAIIGTNAFTLSEYELRGGKDLLVFSVAAEAIPADGEKVLVTGKVIPFDQERLEQDYGENWNRELIGENIEPEYSEQVVLVVEAISPADFSVSEPELDSDL